MSAWWSEAAGDHADEDMVNDGGGRSWTTRGDRLVDARLFGAALTASGSRCEAQGPYEGGRGDAVEIDAAAALGRSC